ncbi:hypothetical protein I553_2477 [Mycobacterium xenopi 4042]|uniref:Uncharacterized protein n=1 Tax=Mycobacterium xenopi 4042 TaxID=1299334 RepID=X8C944_MYCXE|nr:hypothetical protein I553_2477 [Mycobacterium xenopi 4042]
MLQRHGLNVRFGRELAPCPATGGYSEVDFALRREVQAVDDLDNAALAAAGVESLRREIELALSPPAPQHRSWRRCDAFPPVRAPLRGPKILGRRYFRRQHCRGRSASPC